ncbi:hypothetical protein GRI72_12955 [Altererythrobacter marinus]|uniref:Uncharacterized protein n=1 Tax=Pelagerythrobacter marinus TaxID=538382 RepID=A0ABW9UY22_9SPHN|nr:hypothetical protein [Pelagerythrobacter marinus]MXO69729.1 hypothetical protein [Pelagerythrobacter marinus]
MSIDLERVIAVSHPPAEGAKEWRENALEGVKYVVGIANRDPVVIFTSSGQSLIVGVLAPLENLRPPDFDDLGRMSVMLEESWSLTWCSGGGEPDRAFLSPPLDSPGCKSLVGGEKLLFRRSFEGVDRGLVRTEISQKLVHALGLYWLDEESAYCRLDDHGDVEPVIRLQDISAATGQNNDVIVTIKRGDLHNYMALTGMGLVIKFDFTRFEPGSFMGWHGERRFSTTDTDISFHGGQQHNSSFVNGCLVVLPDVGPDDVLQTLQRDWRDDGKQYASFIAQDWKNDRIAEISCAPDALASYFEKDSPLPFQVTPAFFKPEVLLKYKSNREKYKVENRSISCRGAWHLKSYDINEAGQVHAYLYDLAKLPYSEQLYWKSFNEDPRAPISKRAFRTDFEGDWDTTHDPLEDIKSYVKDLNRVVPTWWLPRAEALIDATNYPVTASPDEWAESILSLDQLVVEGFSPSGLRTLLAEAAVDYEKNWQSLKLLHEILLTKGIDAEDVQKILKPLKEIHHIRSKAKGHASGSQRANMIKTARTEHGSLTKHFREACIRCQQSIERIIDIL